MSLTFTHLETHSHYTFLGSTLSVTELVTRASAEGVSHLALTDTNALYGVLAFNRACQESLILSRELGYPRGVAWALYFLGAVAMSQGDYGEAATHCEESLALFRQLGSKDGIAWLLYTLGYVALFQGEYGRAASRFVQSLVLRREMGDKVRVAYCLAGLAGVVGSQGRSAPAARLFGAATALLDARGASLIPIGRAAYDRNLVAMRASMAEAAFEAA